MKRQILEAIEKGIRMGLLESGFNFSLDDLDHIEDYSLKKKKLDREFFKDEFDRQQKEYEEKYIKPLFLPIIDKIVHKQNLTKEEIEQFNKYSNSNTAVAIYKVSDKDELIELINKVINQFGTEVNLNWIDTSNIEDMKGIFLKSAFNGDISKWNISNVKDMIYMFYGSKFNGDISKWDVSNVENMNSMFSFSKFNGDISEWDVSHVENMGYMFSYSKFNGDISKWDVSRVENMDYMFNSSNFNGDISKWDVSAVCWMDYMFNSSKFNGDISKWNTQNVKTHYAAFLHCPIKAKYKPKFIK